MNPYLNEKLWNWTRNVSIWLISAGMTRGVTARLDVNKDKCRGCCKSRDSSLCLAYTTYIEHFDWIVTLHQKSASELLDQWQQGLYHKNLQYPGFQKLHTTSSYDIWFSRYTAQDICKPSQNDKIRGNRPTRHRQNDQHSTLLLKSAWLLQVWQYWVIQVCNPKKIYFSNPGTRIQPIKWFKSYDAFCEKFPRFWPRFTCCSVRAEARFRRWREVFYM